MVSKRTFNSLSYAQKNRFKERSDWVRLGEVGCSTAEISAYTGHHIRTVQRWRKRIENDPVFLDRPRSGRTPVFTELMQQKITAFFCQMDPLPGCHSLTLKWAAVYFNQHLSFLGRTISASSVGRILRRHSLKPHLHKYFLQITDPDFFSILPILVDLYLNPPEYLFSFDECPGIQALKKSAPPLPPGQGKSGGRYSEPNHARTGTLDLFAFLDIKTGTVFGECTENHRAETLIRIFKKHVSSLPEDAVIHYICDNLSPHSCHEFCEVVAELCSVEYPKKKLKTKRQRQVWLQQDNKRIIVHFTPKHGSWLNMVEIWFGIMGQKCLKHNSFNSVETLASFLSDFVKTWNQHFAHPFKWTYNGGGLHEKAVQRLITHIAIENQHMDLSFLCSQLELMLNLLDGYFKQVSLATWRLLEEVVDRKTQYLDKLISASEKPKVKSKAEMLLPKMIEKLRKEILSHAKKIA